MRPHTLEPVACGVGVIAIVHVDVGRMQEVDTAVAVLEAGIRSSESKGRTSRRAPWCSSPVAVFSWADIISNANQAVFTCVNTKFAACVAMLLPQRRARLVWVRWQQQPCTCTAVGRRRPVRGASQVCTFCRSCRPLTLRGWTGSVWKPRRSRGPANERGNAEWRS